MTLPAMHLQASCNVVAPRTTARMSMFTSGHCLNQRSKAVDAQQLSSCSRVASGLWSRQSHCLRSPSSVQTSARQGGDSKLVAGDGFQERVVQVRRVTKVVKGGKQMSFRHGPLFTPANCSHYLSVSRTTCLTLYVQYTFLNGLHPPPKSTHALCT